MTQIDAQERALLIKRAAGYPNISRDLSWIPKIASQGRLDAHPLIRILHEEGKMQRNYLSALDADLAILSGVSNIHQACARMSNYEQFLDERPTLRLAADYVRKGFKVDFIPEAKQPTPDFCISMSGSKCNFEVKHLSGRNTLHVMFDDVRELVSPYYVRVNTEKFQLVTQAKQLARTITDEIEALKAKKARPTFEAPHKKDLGYASFMISTKPSGVTGQTSIGMHYGSVEKFDSVSKHLSRLLGDARDQLLVYAPREINIIALDADGGTILDDEVQDTLYASPGLFNETDYEGISVVKFVSNNILRSETLFLNDKNQHVKDREVQHLNL